MGPQGGPLPGGQAAFNRMGRGGEEVWGQGAEEVPENSGNGNERAASDLSVWRKGCPGILSRFSYSISKT